MIVYSTIAYFYCKALMHCTHVVLYSWDIF